MSKDVFGNSKITVTLLLPSDAKTNFKRKNVDLQMEETQKTNSTTWKYCSVAFI